MKDNFMISNLVSYNLNRAYNSILCFRLKVKKKLGWGNFSTVWQCKHLDKQMQVAVKVNKSDKEVADMARDEIKLLKCIGKAAAGAHEGSKHVLRLVGQFEVEGPNGLHVCLSLELLGCSLLRCYKPGKEGMPLAKVREVMAQVMEGLDFLHTKARIIHTDIKPENILLAEPGTSGLPENETPLKVKIGDLGSACWTTRRFSVSIGTREYRAPEALLGVEEYGPEVDVWAAACTAFELATGEYLFKPKERQGLSRDEDHMLRITELVGHLPRSIIKSGCWGSKFYAGRRLKNVDQRNIKPYSLFQVRNFGL